MAFNINTFRSELELGGARPSLFEVRLTGPVGGIGAAAADLLVKSPFMVRAASLPSQTVGTLTASYFGRQIKLAGNRTFEDWTTTIVNDEDFKIRNAIEIWQQRINSHTDNLREFGANPNQYKGQATVTQYGKTGNVLRVYTFNGFYPSTLAPIDLAWDADALEEFACTWSYDYWTVAGPTAVGEVPN